MTAAAHTLPSYEQLLDEIRFLEHRVKELSEDKEHLEDIVRLLKRLRFAPKSEIQGGQGRTIQAIPSNQKEERNFLNKRVQLQMSGMPEQNFRDSRFF